MKRCARTVRPRPQQARSDRLLVIEARTPDRRGHQTRTPRPRGRARRPSGPAARAAKAPATPGSTRALARPGRTGLRSPRASPPHLGPRRHRAAGRRLPRPPSRHPRSRDRKRRAGGRYRRVGALAPLGRVLFDRVGKALREALAGLPVGRRVHQPAAAVPITERLSVIHGCFNGHQRRGGDPANTEEERYPARTASTARSERSGARRGATPADGRQLVQRRLQGRR